MSILTNTFRSFSLLSCLVLLAAVGCAAPVSDSPEGTEGGGDEHTGEASRAVIFNPGGPPGSTSYSCSGTTHGWCECGEPDNTCAGVDCHGALLRCYTTGLCFCTW